LLAAFVKPSVKMKKHGGQILNLRASDLRIRAESVPTLRTVNQRAPPKSGAKLVQRRMAGVTAKRL